MAPEHTWRKSRGSENNMSCVEVRNTLDQVRDSKNPTGPALRGNLPALVQALREGRFDG